jgi:PAS domain S-box-containing protein
LKSKKPKKQSGDPKGDILRQRAEKRLSKKPANLRKMPAEDIEKLMHELQVHQVELEMQNDELRRVQEEIEGSRSKYSDLYDYAPVGYFIFDHKGQILEANLTGARLLGVERPLLIRKPFNLFVMRDFLNLFRSHHLKVLKSTALETCKLQLRKKDGTSFFAQLESLPIKDTQGDFRQIRSAVTDITERTRLQKRSSHLATLDRKSVV